MTRLQEDFPIDDVMELPDPDGREFTESEDGVRITLEELQQVTMELPITGIQQSIEPLKKVLESGLSEVSFIAPASYGAFTPNDFNYAKNKFLRLLNKHSKTKVQGSAKENALKNKVVYGINKVVRSLQNQPALYTPIAMTEPQAAAARSSAGEEAKHACADNPATKFIMQVQNMVGKEVIGLTAVSLKVFFGVSSYLNNEIKKISPSMLDGDVVNILNKCIVKDPLNIGKYKVFANLNFRDLLDQYAVRPRYLSPESWQEWMVTPKGEIINLSVELENLQRISDTIDASDSLSALLSAATDRRYRAQSV